jgi:Rap1a immunity proteins
MRPVCWGCCIALILLIVAMVTFIVWTIAATNPVWKAEDVGSANFMVPFCKVKPIEAFTNPNAAYLHGRCMGFLENVMLMTDVLPRQDPSVCTKIPVGTTLGQMRDVVVKYAEEHPNQINNDFGRFAYSALHQAWPCKG